MTTPPALLIAGHGTADDAGAEEFRAFTDRVGKRLASRSVPVAGGFIELSPPPIAQSVAELVASGHNRIAAVPLMLVAAGHAKGDIPAALAREKLRHPGLHIAYGRPLGPHPTILRLLRERLSEAAEHWSEKGEPLGEGAEGAGGAGESVGERGGGLGVRGGDLGARAERVGLRGGDLAVRAEGAGVRRGDLAVRAEGAGLRRGDLEVGAERVGVRGGDLGVRGGGRGVRAETDGETMVLLVGRGSTDPDANSEVAKVARLLAETTGAAGVEYAFISLTPPSVPQGLARCAALGARRVVVLPYFLFGGVLPDRVKAQSTHPHLDIRVANVLGDTDALADLVIERYAEALTGDIRMNCDSCVYRVALPGFEAKLHAPQTPHHHPHDGRHHDPHDGRRHDPHDGRRHHPHDGRHHDPQDGRHHHPHDDRHDDPHDRHHDTHDGLHHHPHDGHRHQPFDGHHH